MYSEPTAQKTDLALVTQEESLPARGTSFTGKGGGIFPITVTLKWNIDTY